MVSFFGRPNFNPSSGLETVEVLPTTPKDGQVVIHKVNGVSTIKVYDEQLGDWTIPAGGGSGDLGYTPINKAGDTVVGDLILKDGVSIIPQNPDGAILGSPDKPFKDLFVGKSSIYVDGNKVISSTETTIDVTTTPDQHLSVSTSGLGTTRIASNKEVILYSDDDLNLQAKGDITTLSKGRVTFKTDADGEDIVFETQGAISNINFKSKKAVNFVSPETTFTSKPKVNGVNVITEGDIDGTSVQLFNNKLVVKNVDGLTIGVADINNWLNGTSSNLQQQLNSVNSTITTLASGMEYRGKVNTFADLSTVSSPTNGTLVVVLTDESQSNGRSMYVYSEDLVSWEFIGSFTFSDKFIELTDTPSSYLGSNGRIVKVDETNNQLIFSYVNWSELQNKPTSTVADIDDAVSKKHTHSNKPLLDSYTQTESDLADSVAKKHEHTNMSVLNKFSEDATGKPLYNGLSIGSGSSGTGGGHVIQNNGIDMTQRDKLNFKGFTITDDSTNNTTIIEANASNKASDITVEDVNGYFTENKLEGILAELFQVSDSVKSSYVNAIGLPLTTSDTNANNVTKLQQIKLKMATNLNNKDIPTLPSDSLDKMADDIALIPNVSLTGIKKVTKLNVVSPYQHQVTLEQPLKLEDIATSVLKYVHGADNVVQYNAEYNNGESSSFNYNPNEVQFDGFMNIKDSWDYPLTTVGTDYFETGDIDFSQFTSYGGDATINVDELNVNIKGLKTTSAVVEASGDISINGVESLDKINWINTIGGNGISKLIVSFDGGITWKSYKNGQWITVNVNNAEDFKLNGMDKNTVDALTNTELSIARDGSNFIRFAYYLERPTYSDVAKNDKIQLVVSMEGYNEIANNDVFDYSYDPLTKTLTYDFYQDATYTINYIDSM